MHRIAIVEDDPELGDYLLQLFKHEGYEAVLYPSPGRFFDALIQSQPELLLLDMQLPGMHGREIIRVLRGNPQTRHMLIVAMSGERAKTSDVIEGLETGADEYLLKPMDPTLLTVRLAALLRRRQNGPPEEEALRVGELSVLPEQRLCRLKGKDVELTRLEFDLLVYFIRQTNRVLTRSLLLETVWQGDPSMNTRTVDKHVETLRRKLGPFGKKLETVIRVGYILRIEGASGS